jgi:hypothetical protein
MRFFLLHILIKDLSFMFFYFLLMKYNITNESVLIQALKNHPTVSEWSIWSIIQGSIFYNLTTLIFSLITYFPIFYIFKKIII